MRKKCSKWIARNWFYCFGGVVALIFTYLAYNNTNQIFSIWALGSFMTILVKWMLDHNALINQHYLNSGIVTKIYDKLVEFWEEYIHELYEILHKWMQEWRTENMLDYGRWLTTIRRKYIVYIPKQVNEALEDIEARMRKIWAESSLLNSIPVWDKRSKLVDEIADDFDRLFIKKEGEKVGDGELYLEKIIYKIVVLIWAPKMILERNNLLWMDEVK